MVTNVTNQSATLPELSEPERACLALAWAAMLAGARIEAGPFDLAEGAVPWAQAAPVWLAAV